MKKYQITISLEQEAHCYVETDDIEKEIEDLERNFNWDSFDKYTDISLVFNHTEVNQAILPDIDNFKASH